MSAMLRTATCVLALFAGAAAAAAEPFTFRFAPPLDRPVVQTVSTTVMMKAGGLETRRVMKERTVLRYRKSGNGYLLTGTLTDAAVTVDGKDVMDDFAQAFQGITITYELANDGKLKAVRGYGAVVDKVVAAMSKDAPPEMKRLVTNLLSEEALITRARTEWDGRISGFAGSSAKVGDVYTSTDQIVLPNGDAVTFHTTTTIAGRAPCGNVQCVRITFKYDSDPAAMKKTLEAVTGTLPGEQLVTDGITITGSGERLIDPATMNIYSETNERTMRMTVTVSDGTKMLTERTEKKDYAFEYSPDPQSSSGR